MIDVSHGNSGKSYLRPIEVARDVAASSGGDTRAPLTRYVAETGGRRAPAK